MDIREFATQFMENVNAMVDMEGSTPEEEIAQSIIEYMEDAGEVGAPEICSFKKKGAAISAYDYNDENNSLDLFILVPTDTLLGKINNGKIDSAFSKMYRFYDEVTKGTLLKDDESPNSELQDAQDLIASCKGKVGTLRLYVLTNGLSEYDTSTVDDEENGFIMEQNVWDIQRVYQQHCVKAGKDKIEIDFPQMYDTDLQCLKMARNATDLDAYLAIIPGVILARIYKKFQHGLLEKNVRTFLQFKSKVNRGIRKTLQEQPDMFFSYNNGISTTASEIETIERDGALYITRLVNWQIVNGGQTTASIASTYSERGADLSKVFVPMKISVINNKEKDTEIVGNISRYANSQTAVKDSDFSANDPYLVDLENLSRSEWVPNGKMKPVTKWYFERTRGQYLDELAQKTGADERMFRTTYPKNQKLVKTDIAKYQMCWNQRPELSISGGEKNYQAFVKEIKANPVKVNAKYYHHLIAKAILFKKMDKIVKEFDLGGYKSYVNTYTLAALSYLSKKTLNLDYIWEHQDIQPELAETIRQIVPTIWSHLSEQHSGSTSYKYTPREWASRAKCWEELKVKLSQLPKLPEELLFTPEEMVDDDMNQAQKVLLAEMWQVPANIWFEMSAWAKERGALTPMYRKMAYSFGRFKANNRMFSIKQATEGKKILSSLIELGYEPSSPIAK